MPLTFEQQVKRDLNLDYILGKRVRFPKGLNWIGGFIMPLFPFFFIANRNKRWRRRAREAVVHELMHIRMLIDGWIIYLLLIPGVITFITTVTLEGLPIADTAVMVVSSLAVAGTLTWFEYATHKKVEDYSYARNIPVGHHREGIYIQYFLTYLAYIVGIKLLSKLVGWLL